MENEGFGRMRILSDLRARRIAGNLAEEAAARALAGHSEAELIDAYIERRIPSLTRPNPIENEQKLASAYRRLRRAGFSAKDRDEVKAAFKLVYASGLNIAQATGKAGTMKLGAAAQEFLDFVANAKKRGICPLKRGADDEISI